MSEGSNTDYVRQLVVIQGSISDLQKTAEILAASPKVEKTFIVGTAAGGYVLQVIIAAENETELEVFVRGVVKHIASRYTVQQITHYSSKSI